VADKVLPLSAPELTVFPAFRLAALLLFMLESLEFCLSMRDVRAGRPLRRSQMASMSQMICMKGRTSTRMFMAKTKKSANESPPPPPEPPVEYALGDRSSKATMRVILRAVVSPTLRQPCCFCAWHSFVAASRSIRAHAGGKRPAMCTWASGQKVGGAGKEADRACSGSSLRTRLACLPSCAQRT